MIFAINGRDFTDVIATEGYTVNEEDLHADGSGRNQLTGTMEYTIVASKRYIDITTRNGVSPERMAEFMNALKSNNRQNNFTVWNGVTNETETFRGYINKRQVGIYFKNPYRTLLKQTSIHIAEM